MLKEREMKLAVFLLVLAATAARLTWTATVAKFEFVEEWNLWKSVHGKVYETQEVWWYSRVDSSW